MTGICKFVGDVVIDTSTGEIVKEINKPTDKQMDIIGIIESNLKIKFKGNTKSEARQFISDHMEESKQAVKEYGRERRKMWDDINFEETHRYNSNTGQWECVDPRDDWGEPGTKEYDECYYDDLADRLAFDPNFG